MCMSVPIVTLNEGVLTFHFHRGAAVLGLNPQAGFCLTLSLGEWLLSQIK